MTRAMADDSRPARGRELELADGSKVLVTEQRSAARRSREQLRGLDGAATAGLVLAQLYRMPDGQQLAVMAASVDANQPCSCGASCCAGSKFNPQWLRVVLKLCEHLKEEADITKTPGKKGMSTTPELRKFLVERFFLERIEREPALRYSLVYIAKKCGVTEKTVGEHRKLIDAYLEEQHDLGWQSMDVLLSEAGLVGFIP